MRSLAFAVCACVLLGATASSADVDYSGPGGCHKGIFWPFSRSKGDCLTDTEKKEGKTGVYGDPTANTGAPAQNATVAAPAPSAAAPAPASNAPPPANAQVAAPAPTPNANPGPPAQPASSGSFSGLFGSSGSRDPGLLNDNPAFANNGGAYPVVVNTPPPVPAAAPLGAPNSNPVAASPPARAPAVANNSANAPAVAAIAPAPAPAPANRDAIITRTNANGVQCTKGIFWPFSREKGDCLTDAEKKNGQKGNYLDPTAGAAPAAPANVVAAPAPRAIAAPAPVATIPPPTPPAAPAVQAPPPASAPVAVASIEARPAATAPETANRDAVITRTNPNGVQCTKGIFWPFSRSKGDCLTDTEKKEGKTGNYLDPTPGAAPAAPANVVAAPAPRAAAAPAPVATIAAPTPPAAPAVQAPPPASAPVAVASVEARPAATAPEAANRDAVITRTNPNGVQCNKGIFWPFSRSKGDCLTDAEKKNGKTGNYLDPTPGAAAPAAATAPVQPASGAAVPEKPQVNASVAAASTDARPAAVPPANGAVVTKTDNNEAKCTKGIFWPFVRSAGDCQTDAEKKNAAAKNSGGAQ